MYYTEQNHAQLRNKHLFWTDVNRCRKVQQGNTILDKLLEGDKYYFIASYHVVISCPDFNKRN